MSHRNGTSDRDREAASDFLRRRQVATAGRGRAALPAPPVDEAPALPAAVCLLEEPVEAPVSWLIPEMIPAAEPVLFAGPEGEMKTTITLLLACAVAAGGPFLGRETTMPGPVLLVSGEDSAGVVRNRCQAIARGHGWGVERVLRQLHFIDADGADLAQARWRLHLLAQVDAIRPRLVVLDPLANLVSGEENSARPELRQLWRLLTKPSGAAVALVHHAGKRGDGSKSKRDRIRGHTDVVAASRATFFVERDASGIVVENIKQSRADKVRPFVLEPHIQSDPRNRGLWELARFDTQSVRQAARSAAESWLLEFLCDCPGTTTTEIRKGASVAGVSHFDVQKAQRTLSDGGLIVFESGPRGAKYWRLADTERGPNDPARQGGETDPADPAGTLPGQGHGEGADPACRPYRGGQGQAPASGAPGRVDRVDAEEAEYRDDERAALEDGL